ncbi:MAG: SAF domain-containing protein [Clostridium sp.]|nr:SAF domain-containing protein [Acetatifactor muris]MCM1527604.1 SAF domain-containing protein [Bacteroides sp.]MCM1563845.1 SAF domain-containing protein [Clostridium sp.]
MKNNRKRIWDKVKIGSILAALIAAVGVFAVMLQMEKKMLDGYERGSIYTAVRDIPKGEKITLENCEQYLCRKEVDKNIVPAAALAGPEQIEGLFARTAIDEGTLLTVSMFEREDEITALMEQPVIVGFRADDLYQVVGGVLRRGDRIHIYTVPESGVTQMIRSNVFVEQVFDSAGNVISGENDTASAQRVNVYLDAEEVERFYTELAGGTLRVVKVCE